MRPLHEQVLVITGASSGIGRCTAIEAARRGARIVLASRGLAALESVREEIARDGGQALVVPTDVADPALVETLGDQAMERFGRIDTWFNNAGVGMIAAFADHTHEEFRRIVDVNLMGVVYGCSVAVRRMRESGGTIINMASVEADRALPLHSAYAASKHAVEGFSEALRMELEHQGLPIRVAVLKPASIDTPFFGHARAKIGVQPKPIPPVYDPLLVAKAALHAAEHPVRNLTIGGFGAALSAYDFLAPTVVDEGMVVGGYPLQETDRPRDESAPDNRFSPPPGLGAVRGGWNGRQTSLYTAIQLHPVLTRTLTAGVGVAGVAVGWSLLRRAT